MPSVIVVGAGAIGLASAYYLRKSGCEVTVVDPNPAGSQASSHNAGWLIPSMSTPVPAPGMLLQALRWMTKRDSPLYVTPSLRPDFVWFMLRMLRNCDERRFRAGSAVLAELSSDALALFDDLTDDGVRFETHSRPLTMLFRDRHKLDVRVRELELLEGELPGFSWRHLDRSELVAFSPALDSRVTAGISSEGDRSVDPTGFSASLAAACRRDGVAFRLGTPALLATGADGRTEVLVGEESLRADRVVVAAGVWTNQALKGIGERVALQAGKGYGYDVPVSQQGPANPVYLADAKVAITPLDAKVRLAGTMGFGRVDDSIDRVRAEGILTGVRSFFPDWPRSTAELDPWTGMRPMSPDGVPIIGPLRRRPEVTVATGHAMLGISLAPVTGRLVAELVTGETSPETIPTLLPGRF